MKVWVTVKYSEDWGDFIFDKVTAVFTNKEAAQRFADDSEYREVEGPFEVDEYEKKD